MIKCQLEIVHFFCEPRSICLYPTQKLEIFSSFFKFPTHTIFKGQSLLKFHGGYDRQTDRDRQTDKCTRMRKWLNHRSTDVARIKKKIPTGLSNLVRSGDFFNNKISRDRMGLDTPVVFFVSLFFKFFIIFSFFLFFFFKHIPFSRKNYSSLQPPASGLKSAYRPQHSSIRRSICQKKYSERGWELASQVIFATDSAGQLDVLGSLGPWVDGDALGVDGAQVGILETV